MTIEELRHKLLSEIGGAARRRNLNELEQEIRADEQERIAQEFEKLVNCLKVGILRDGFGKDAARFVRSLKNDKKRL